ncbi:peptidase M23-like protein [Hasllibacter halocynthiae]|uniref:Peptidase M23-like protein n=1 Tax=Hasllibacter halocynthiae TaxID=595589 RepID=A0A2T0X118_9RHOB|nr:M23 family metallopeptidase [Hasllibacter halocynthiae]PRY92617.1 peptidase M23-like protein [Hasllibacter halocynthiae]
MIRTALIGAAFAAAPFASAARDIPLAFPVACTPGETCFVQNYVDRDPTGGVADLLCGPLSYDGHEGTDIALPTLAAMERGVDVLAAAPGIVRGTRDALPDVSFRDEAAPDLAGRDCGNGVLVDHGGGWSTQYCHLRRGSVAVRSGQRIRAGHVLGQVGLSGLTEFPHLHFTVREGDAPVDPFDRTGVATCDDGDLHPLWRDPVPYDPAGAMAAGLSSTMPSWDAIRAGGVDPAPSAAGELHLWAAFHGGRAGDEVAMAITGPNGTIHESTLMLDRDQAQFFRSSGLRPPEGGWPPGRYEGRAALIRDGQTIETQATSTLLRRR